MDNLNSLKRALFIGAIISTPVFSAPTNDTSKDFLDSLLSKIPSVQERQQLRETPETVKKTHTYMLPAYKGNGSDIVKPLNLTPKSNSVALTNPMDPFSSRDTAQWGLFDIRHPAVLTINGGDSVIIETMTHGLNIVVPGLTAEEIFTLRKDSQLAGRGVHSIVGPIFVNNENGQAVQPGDFVKIKINKIIPRAYGFNQTTVGLGEFPTAFPDGEPIKNTVKYFYLDKASNTTVFPLFPESKPQKIVLPLAPFPGILSVGCAARGKDGHIITTKEINPNNSENLPVCYDVNGNPAIEITTTAPGTFGGNMDNRELKAGSTMYVRANVPGALVWTGDSHAVQGNGEVNLTALETGFMEMNVTIDALPKNAQGQVPLTNEKNIDLNPLVNPIIETPTQWITMGFEKGGDLGTGVGSGLNGAFVQTKTDAITFLKQQKNLDDIKAADLFNRIADCNVTQVVDIRKGVHCLLPKNGEPAAAKTDNAYVTKAQNENLNKAMDEASFALIKEVQDKTGLSRMDAYALASLAMDCHIDNLNETAKNVTCSLSKELWKSS